MDLQKDAACSEAGGRSPDECPEDRSGQTLGAYFRRLGPAGPLALIAATAPALVGFTLLGLVPWIAGWIQLHPLLGALLYFSCYAVLGGLGFLPTYAYSVLGGYAFGFRAGLALAMASYAAASMLAYLIARRASGERVMEIIRERPKWGAVYDALLGSGFRRTLLIVTLLRMPPNSPFALTNLVMAATKVQPLAFVLGTVAGIAPRTGAAVFIGAAFQLDYVRRSPLWLVISGIVLTLIVLGIIGHLANQAITRVTGAPAPVASASVSADSQFPS